MHRIASMASHMPPPTEGGEYFQPPPPDPSSSSQLPQVNQTAPVMNHPPAPNHPPLISDAPQYPTEHLSSPFVDSGSPFNPDSGQDESSFAFKSPQPLYSGFFRTINQRYQFILDVSTPHWAARWAFSIILLLVFMARIVFAQGWYIICYGLSIYYLNLFIGFLSPKIDPAFQDGDDFDFDDPGDSDTGPMLPTRANDEFRPFIRRLPEFKFWLSASKATLISLFLTLFEIFDLPVFWPILLLYFILLFVTTMRQQIRHMIKYGYVPWDKGKKKYGARKEEPLDSFSTTI